jgi:peroxisomal membrane protein 2
MSSASAPARGAVTLLRTRTPATTAADAPAPPPSSPFAAVAGGGSSQGPFCPNNNDNPHHPPTLLRLAWSRYQSQLRTRPLATKALTSAVVAALSDALAQWISSSTPKHNKRSTSYDLARTLKFALLGLVWSGPSAHYWQSFLQRAVPPPPAGASPERAAATLLKKVALDQFTYGPVCNLVFMAYTTLFVAGSGVSELGRRVRRDFAGVQRNGWRVWPLASAINLRFVPLEYRVLFANLVALVWTTYLNLATRG